MRLREQAEKWLIYKCREISIPSGAIKSFNAPVTGNKNIPISIPSGAIKRKDWTGHVRDGSRFQFLLVRLRVFGEYGEIMPSVVFQFLLVRLRESIKQNFCRATAISIPSGAIKSIGEKLIANVEPLFQFLLVRLRVLFAEAR